MRTSPKQWQMICPLIYHELLSHLSAQMLTGRIRSCTVSEVKTALPLLSWSRTSSTESSFGFCRVTQVTCHSVFQRCQMLAQTPQRKPLKTKRTIIRQTPSQSCAIPANFCNFGALCVARISALLFFESSERRYESSCGR